MKKIKGLLSSVLVVSLLALGIYWAFEPEISKISIGQEAWAATTASQEIDVFLTVSEEITLTAPSNITMGSGNISMSQNDVFGTGDAWNVKTNSTAGYTLTFNSDQADCMDSGADQFTDYTEASTGTPDTWSVDVANYEFGFSVYGDDVDTGKWGSETTCGSGSTPDSTLKWMGFTGVTAITVATSGSETATAGTDTIFCVGAEQGTNVFAPDGSYTADITGTATVQ